MKPNNLVTGIVSGLAVGAILGILFAPDKGCNTRRKIAKKGNDLKDGIKDGIDSFVSSAENKYEEFTSKVESVIDEGKSRFGNIKNDLK